MVKEETYTYLLVTLLFLCLSCFLCTKNMKKNRGNFINLPAWRKATKSIFDIFISFTGVALLIYNKLYMPLLCSALVPLFLAGIIILLCVSYEKFINKKTNKNSFFRTQLQPNNKILNINVLEYAIYGLIYISKAVVFFFVGCIGTYKIIKSIWAIETAPEDSYLPRLISYIANTISNDFSIYLIGTFLCTLFYSSLVMIIFSITLDGENNNQENQQKYFSIRRKFNLKEHSI